ncbi:hypothetical protein POPTR_002G043701v4 [Populus trichocarpa]|uniref:Uncharacterized protein n=1 Tax=Populus trichocarpa TaxID=3694 RepID=A0ACC0TCN3_POPTR|nr:hypothetical protein BDE02_02G041200 [Populus trichocarpa]KAI9399064.1 hypothetical protein POPTR_002G043701v4 [Populus trichocarpa]
METTDCLFVEMEWEECSNQVAFLGNNMAIQIAAFPFLCRLFTYKHYHKECTLTLQHFIVFFGAFELPCLQALSQGN